MEDYVQVIALWTTVGLTVGASDSRAALEHKFERDADLFLVAEGKGNDALIGTVLGAYDGRRAWINHLAIAPGAQGCGLGRLLMDELEQRLRAKGCVKVNLLIKPTNAQVQGFDGNLGYDRDVLIFMAKWLV